LQIPNLYVMDKVQVVLIAVAGISYVASLVFAYLNQALQGTKTFLQLVVNRQLYFVQTIICRQSNLLL